MAVTRSRRIPATPDLRNAVAANCDRCLGISPPKDAPVSGSPTMRTSPPMARSRPPSPGRACQRVSPQVWLRSGDDSAALTHNAAGPVGAGVSGPITSGGSMLTGSPARTAKSWASARMISLGSPATCLRMSRFSARSTSCSVASGAIGGTVWVPIDAVVGEASSTVDGAAVLDAGHSCSASARFTGSARPRVLHVTFRYAFSRAMRLARNAGTR